jgi:hypothetical protein
MTVRQKLLVTIVKKEKAKAIIEATKKAGATGGTTLYGTGFGYGDRERFLGIPIERERGIILTVVPESICSRVEGAICKEANLEQPKQGLCFIISLREVSGLSHFVGDRKIQIESNKGVGAMDEEVKRTYDLIVTIVNKGDSEKVVDFSKKAGAEGGTILHGRGTGIHEQAKLFNILIEPEKDIVLTLIEKEKRKRSFRRSRKAWN